MRKRLLTAAAIYLIIVIFFMWLTPKKIIWEDSFSRESYEPYGSFILYQELQHIFPKTRIKEQSLYSVLSDNTEVNGNFIIIDAQFNISDEERNQLLEWVSLGNNILISANQFSNNLLDTLNLQTNYLYIGMQDILDKKLTIRLTSEFEEEPSSYEYAKQSSILHFTTLYDSLPHPDILSIAISPNSEADSQDSSAIMVRQQYGNGTIYLHSLPYAFTNYYMLFQNNYEFASKALSFLPEENIFWDEYYKPKKNTNKAILSVFLNERPFKWAYILGISLLLAYILFQLKRNQRVIPTIQPPENRSLEFTRTIGDLYFHTGDHADLVQKMEKHFKEFLKEKYFIHDYSATEEQVTYLSMKSGKTIGLISTIQALFRTAKQGDISDKLILNLSKKLHKFYYGK